MDVLIRVAGWLTACQNLSRSLFSVIIRFVTRRIERLSVVNIIIVHYDMTFCLAILLFEWVYALVARHQRDNFEGKPILHNILNVCLDQAYVSVALEYVFLIHASVKFFL